MSSAVRTIVDCAAGLHIKLHTRILYCTYVYPVLRLYLVLSFRTFGGIPVCLVVHVRIVLYVCVLYLHLYPLLYIGAVCGKLVSCLVRIYTCTMSCISLCFNAAFYVTFLIEISFYFANRFAADYIPA